MQFVLTGAVLIVLNRAIGVQHYRLMASAATFTDVLTGLADRRAAEERLADQVPARADTAMYTVKAQGRNDIRLSATMIRPGQLDPVNCPPGRVEMVGPLSFTGTVRAPAANASVQHTTVAPAGKHS